MIFFRLTINYSNNVPNTDETLIQYVNSEFCVRCGQQFINASCQACSEFGPVDQSTIFVQFPYQKYVQTNVYQVKDVQLTNLQAEASQFILTQSSKKEVLIWAVCGSGKTEITFEIIVKHLNRGEYIAFVIPRKDILNEIAERLKSTFPGIDLVMMSSEHKVKRDGQVYVLTPNQLLRFKNAFSLIICDEVDAYPFMEDPRFIYAVETARREQSATIYLTSTPSSEFLKRDLAIFTIYERWHQKPLPEPKLIYQNRLLFKCGLVNSHVQKLLDNPRQLLMFIGQIDVGIKLCKILKKRGYICEFVHASDELRSEKISQFRQQEMQVLLTTTILERGVTFKGIDVLVIDADNYVYNVAALVQIAGRVNRKIDDQTGQVVFCYESITKTIEKACDQIKAMNEKSRKN